MHNHDCYWTQRLLCLCSCLQHEGKCMTCAISCGLTELQALCCMQGPLVLRMWLPRLLRLRLARHGLPGLSLGTSTSTWPLLGPKTQKAG